MTSWGVIPEKKDTSGDNVSVGEGSDQVALSLTARGPSVAGQDA